MDFLILMVVPRTAAAFPQNPTPGVASVAVGAAMPPDRALTDGFMTPPLLVQCSLDWVPPSPPPGQTVPYHYSYTYVTATLVDDGVMPRPLYIVPLSFFFLSFLFKQRPVNTRIPIVTATVSHSQP